MCLTVALADLGPADALMDLGEGLIVLRPTMTTIQRRLAVRRLLHGADIPQVGGLVLRCHCGEPIDTQPDREPAIA